MVHAPSPLAPRKVLCVAAWLILLASEGCFGQLRSHGSLIPSVIPDAWADELTISVEADKTTVELGDPVTLTITLRGDLSDVDLSQLQFPEGVSIAGRSQSTSFSIRAGTMERSMSLVYVLIPQHPGAFQLGPFTIEHRHKELKTEPIDMTVKKRTLPPSQRLRPPSERFTL